MLWPGRTPARGTGGSPSLIGMAPPDSFSSPVKRRLQSHRDFSRDLSLAALWPLLPWSHLLCPSFPYRDPCEAGYGEIITASGNGMQTALGRCSRRRSEVDSVTPVAPGRPSVFLTRPREGLWGPQPTEGTARGPTRPCCCRVGPEHFFVSGWRCVA